MGVCLRRGVLACSDDGLELRCTAQAQAPGIETCNGLDDDCDGVNDESYDQLGALCSVGVGACQRTGVEVCALDGNGTRCSEVQGEPALELCNDFDDDCDGSTDEHLPQLDTLCQAGVGLCRRSGVITCSQDPAADPECSAVPGPAAETDACDYQDDDCDGQVDEGFVNGDGMYDQVSHCGACGSDCRTSGNQSPQNSGSFPGVACWAASPSVPSIACPDSTMPMDSQ